MEVITSVIVGMIIACTIGMGLKATLAARTGVEDGMRSLLNARETIDFVESLVHRAVSRDTKRRFVLMSSNASPTPDEQFRGITFYADLNDDGRLEWVWIWKDFQQPLNSDYAPYQLRYPIKVAAFDGYRPPGATGESNTTRVGTLLYSLINGNPQCHMVIANHATQFQFWLEAANATQSDTDVTRLRLDAGFHIHDALQSTWALGLNWNQVSPGSWPTQTVPSFTLTRWITPRSIASTRQPAANAAWVDSPTTPNEYTIRDSEVNYRAAILGQPRLAYYLRPR